MMIFRLEGRGLWHIVDPAQHEYGYEFAFCHHAGVKPTDHTESGWKSTSYSRRLIKADVADLTGKRNDLCPACVAGAYRNGMLDVEVRNERD